MGRIDYLWESYSAAKKEPPPISTSTTPSVAPTQTTTIPAAQPLVFEFHKVPSGKENKASYFLQAGAFNNAADADKLNAKLSMLGFEANVQSVTIPDRGVWYRVRLGPYKGADEMNKTWAALKQNGIESTPTKTQ